MSGIRPKVLVTHPEVADEAIALLKEQCDVEVCTELPKPSRADILRRLPSADAVLWASGERLDSQALEAAPRLRIASTMSAGYDHVSVAALVERGVPVGHTPGVLADSVAETALLLALAATRRITAGRLAIERGEWIPGRPRWLLGTGLVGAVAGVVGLGGVGQAVARLLRAVGVSRVLYAAPRPRPATADALAAEHVPLKQLLAESDVVVACCPLNNETRNLFNKEAFNLMKSSAVFVNVSRGEVVDQVALVDVLRKGRILGAGLDVMTPEPLPPDHELLSLDNCVITPHIGSATVATRREMALLAARNILAGLNGEAMPAPIPGSLLACSSTTHKS